MDRSRGPRFLRLALLGGLLACGLPAGGEGAPPSVRFEQSAAQVEAYDFVEVTLRVARPTAANPFRDVSVSGEFRRDGDGAAVRAEGFCDAADGGLHRVRFMPSRPGRYRYSVEYRHGDQRQRHEGTFTARDGRRRGPVRVDPEHPWHFLWEGTGEHYFWNGTTTYWLLGWEDEAVTRRAHRPARPAEGQPDPRRPLRPHRRRQSLARAARAKH
ncbi:MAG: DUF5060 domain-containing protein [Gemmataceae bacterium]